MKDKIRHLKHFMPPVLVCVIAVISVVIIYSFNSGMEEEGEEERILPIGDCIKVCAKERSSCDSGCRTSDSGEGTDNACIDECFDEKMDCTDSCGHPNANYFRSP